MIRRVSIQLAWWVAGIWMQPSVAEDLGVIHFLNGDSLPGKLQTLDREQLTWKSSILVEPATFLIEKVRDLRLPMKPYEVQRTAGHEATLTLTNGDVLRGQLAAITDDSIVLDTWYAGKLTFRRTMVRELAVREMPEYIHRGPLPLEDWTQSTDRTPWTPHEDGGMQATKPGGIARDFPLPDEFTLEFQVRWQGSLRMKLVLFSNDITTEDPNQGYEIVFQRQSVYLRRCGERQWIGHSNSAHELQQNEKAAIRIRASSKTGQFVFYVNDRIIAAWTDDAIDRAELGKGLHFVSQESTPLVISRVDLSKWNGFVEEKLEDRPNIMEFGRGRNPLNFWNPEDESDPDRQADEEGTMALRNGDRIRGAVKSIDDGVIRIETPFKEIAIPVERLRNLAIAPSEPEEPKLENGDVRAWFTDGGSIVFRLEGVTADGRSIQGYSQTFGNAVFDFHAFNRIELNLYDFFRDDEGSF